MLRFLAKSFSRFSRVRFNAVAPGLLKTSASAGIPGYVESYLYAEEVIPRKQAIQTEEAAAVAAFLLSPRSSGINAQQLVVDAGMSINYFDRDLIHRAMRADDTAGQSVSLDNILEGTDAIQDHRAQSPEEVVLRSSMVERVRELMEELDDRETMIIQHRFGMGNKDQKTLKQIGEMVGLTRERVRQIETKVIDKLSRKLRRDEVQR